MKPRRLAQAVMLVLLHASLAAAQALQTTTPEAAGMVPQRLDRLKAVMQDYVDQQRVAGVVTIVLRGGRLVVLEPYGLMDIEKNIPMRKDTIFRIASMSKAVTSIAAVILMEEGRLLLGDPVSKYLPAFKNTSVAVPTGTPGRYGVVPAKRQVTIKDLMTHTAGISYGYGAAADQWKAAGLQGWYLADKKEPIVPLMERLAGLPFDAQPGEKYIYGYNTDILGAVVEKASGMPLNAFVEARIFGPLKMVDTHFYLPPEKRDRLATVYSAGPNGRVVRAADGGTGQGDYVDGPRTCFGGGAGLLSTANDYARMLQMLLNGGELDGVRVLAPKSVEMMTVNQIGRLYDDGTGPGIGFGLGFEVTERVGASPRPDSVGVFGWGSAYYSRYWVDPQEKLVAVILAQLIPAEGLDLQDKFRMLVYQSMIGPAPSAAPEASRKR